MKKTLEEVRQSNLKRILEEEYNNDLTLLAKAIHRSVSAVKKYISPRLERKISRTIARNIEQHLQLSPSYLDVEYHGVKQVHYIMLKVNKNFTFHVVERVQDYAEAVECSALLGEYDVMVKVEVPAYHELQIFYDKLSRLPGVQRTRTYPAVETIRWQRQQSECTILKNPNNFSNYAEEYKHALILEKMEEIRSLENGKISSNNKLQNAIDLNQLMNRVKREYLAIRLHDEKYYNEAGYIAAEKARIEDHVVVKRIITLPQHFTTPAYYTQLNDLLKKAECLSDIGSQIRFLFIEDWVESARNRQPECFAVVDNEYVYLRQNENHSRLLTKNDNLMHYRRAFQVNWDRAMTQSQLLD